MGKIRGIFYLLPLYSSFLILHLLKIGYRLGRTTNVSNVEDINPPTTTEANGRWTSEPTPVARSKGIRPRAAMLAVILKAHSILKILGKMVSHTYQLSHPAFLARARSIAVSISKPTSSKREDKPSLAQFARVCCNTSVVDQETLSNTGQSWVRPIRS